MHMRLIFFVLLLCPMLAIAGQGRDGGWPQSIELLRIAKQNLLDLLTQSSDIDVQDALNNMRDREESIKVEDVDLNLLINLVRKVEDPDVEQIEKSTYSGVRLFYYDDSRIYATRNFYQMQRYQIPVSDINPAIIKEIQILILHEISHLWGYGEENGGINYARTFAVRMANILHGSYKVNFTHKEKLNSLTKAFFYEGMDVGSINLYTALTGKTFKCLDIDSNLVVDKTLGHLENINNSSLRWLIDGFLLAEIYGAETSSVYSAYLNSKGVKTKVKDILVCHLDENKLNEFTDRLVRPYYTRSNLLTSYSQASPIIFQSLLIQDISFIVDNFQETINSSTANQKQIIHNIDFNVKVQNAESYNRLTGRNYKHPKPSDSADVALINSLINADLSTQMNSFWALIKGRVDQLNGEIKSMHSNPSRQLEMDSFVDDFMKEFNLIAKKTHEMESSEIHYLPCYNKKRLGEFYACNIETSRNLSLDRIEKYKSLSTEMNALLKRFTLKAQALN